MTDKRDLIIDGGALILLDAADIQDASTDIGALVLEGRALQLVTGDGHYRIATAGRHGSLHTIVLVRAPDDPLAREMLDQADAEFEHAAIFGTPVHEHADMPPDTVAIVSPPTGAEAECAEHGHDYDIVTSDAGPVAIDCSRCGRRWDYT